MGIVRIPLHSRKYPGMFALVDEEDAALISQYRWNPVPQCCGICYAATTGACTLPNGFRKKSGMLMHRLIMNAPQGIEVDHRDGYGLNNTRANLRLATRVEQGANRKRASNNKSGFKGVYFHRGWKNRPWIACVKRNGKEVYYEGFATAEEAARAYDRVARLVHGEFARTNFPEETA